MVARERNLIKRFKEDRTKKKGSPPKILKGHIKVSIENSPWWDRVVSEVLLLPNIIGRTLSIEDLSQIVSAYPGGNKPRGRTVARRLAPILTLISRGPKGSLGIGATYTIKNIDAEPASEITAEFDALAPDDEWLKQSVKKMTTHSGKK